MTTQAMKICQAAEQLSPIERIEVIEHLFYSLDSKSEREKIDSLWAEESELRLSAYERGEMNAIPAEEVFRKLNAENPNKSLHYHFPSCIMISHSVS